MKRKQSYEAIYDSKSELLILFGKKLENGEYEKYTGKVAIDHREKLVRIYNFPKSEVNEKEKIAILYAILEESVLFPNNKFSQDNSIIGEYVLLINGYLLNGEFKQPGKKYKSIVTEYIESQKCDLKPDIINKMKSCISNWYINFKDKFGKEEIHLKVTNNCGLYKGYVELINTAILLKIYLKGKGYNNLIINLDKNIFSNEKYINILT